MSTFCWSVKFFFLTFLSFFCSPSLNFSSVNYFNLSPSISTISIFKFLSNSLSNKSLEIGFKPGLLLIKKQTLIFHLDRDQAQRRFQNPCSAGEVRHLPKSDRRRSIARNPFRKDFQRSVIAKKYMNWLFWEIR